MHNRNRISLFATAIVALLASTALAQQADKSVQEKLGYPADARLLIIHADDLGMNHSVNRATFAALENHWITSSSILVPCPWFPEVADWAKAHPDADLGIHLALNSEWTHLRWGPVSSRDKLASLLDKDGYFPLLETDVGAHAKPKEADSELRAQIEHAKAAGVQLSHFDTHMTALMQQKDLLKVYEKLGRDYKLPILLDRSGSRKLPEGGTIPPEQALVDSIIEINPGVPPEKWADWYEQTLTALKPGVYEMIVHLAYDDDEMRGTTWDHPDWGSAWRQHDVDMVKSDEFRKFLAGQKFVLVTWKDLGKALNTK
jgi:chitin disaccharide deacetylase